jgi:hypothetical protein
MEGDVITVYPVHPMWVDLLWLALVGLGALLVGLLLVLAIGGRR